MKSIMKIWIVLLVAAIVIPQASFAKSGRYHHRKKASEHMSVSYKHKHRGGHSRGMASVGKKHKSKKNRRYAKLPSRRYRGR
ncbi:MAG: hypothetical protein ACXVCP_11190 [Bdellovibrio sp.]